ncbi:hypothetical protein D3C85_1777690 [compost metagenome]
MKTNRRTEIKAPYFYPKSKEEDQRKERVGSLKYFGHLDDLNNLEQRIGTIRG